MFMMTLNWRIEKEEKLTTCCDRCACLYVDSEVGFLVIVVARLIVDQKLEPAKGGTGWGSPHYSSGLFPNNGVHHPASGVTPATTWQRESQTLNRDIFITNGLAKQNLLLPTYVLLCQFKSVPSLVRTMFSHAHDD